MYYLLPCCHPLIPHFTPPWLPFPVPIPRSHSPFPFPVPIPQFPVPRFKDCPRRDITTEKTIVSLWQRHILCLTFVQRPKEEKSLFLHANHGRTKGFDHMQSLRRACFKSNLQKAQQKKKGWIIYIPPCLQPQNWQIYYPHLLRPVYSLLPSQLTFCGLDPSRYKGYSFRIGAAHAADRGMTDAQIRTLGRWKSNAFF